MVEQLRRGQVLRLYMSHGIGCSQFSQERNALQIIHRERLSTAEFLMRAGIIVLSETLVVTTKDSRHLSRGINPGRAAHAAIVRSGNTWAQPCSLGSVARAEG